MMNTKLHRRCSKAQQPKSTKDSNQNQLSLILTIKLILLLSFRAQLHPMKVKILILEIKMVWRK